MDKNVNKSISSELEEIKEIISHRQYEQALIQLDLVFSDLLNKESSTNYDENLAVSLEIFDSICDKSESTIETTLNLIPKLLDNPQYWIRQDSLLLLIKIIKVVDLEYFDPIIEKIESKFFDNNKKVREAVIQLVAAIFEKSYNYFPELYLTYCNKFEDKSWKVRARAIEGVIGFLRPPKKGTHQKEETPPTNMIEAFTKKIPQLIHDADEEIRGLASEMLKYLCLYLEPVKIIDIILPLLSDFDYNIREKSVWIVGEIGSTHFDEFKALFEKLVLLFSDDIMIIQAKTIDAFVKIGQKNGLKLIEFFKPFICNKFDEQQQQDDILEGISESLIYITLQKMKIILPRMIKNIKNPKEEIRLLIGNCLLKIYIEKPDSFEEELFKIFQSLDPDDWRQRRKTIEILGDLSYILHIQSITIWTVINLKNWQKLEKDRDVLDEIEISLRKINNSFPDIDTEIKALKKRKENFYKGLDSFNDLTKNLLKKAEGLIKTQKFNDAEILLEIEGNEISERIEEYGRILQESEFKRFSVNVFQDFNEARENIFEYISDVKSLMYNKICDGRAKYLKELTLEINTIKERIDRVKLKSEKIKEMEKSLENITNQEKENPEKVEEFLNKISDIRENIYMLEFDIGQTWLKNLEFKEFLKEVTIYWVDVKIEIQQYISNIIYKFRIGSYLGDEEDSLLKKKITYDFLKNTLQNTVLQAIQSQRSTLENFDEITEPINQELLKKRFKETQNLVDLTIRNLYATIENYNHEINNLVADIEKISITDSSKLDIRKYIKNWTDVKDVLLDKIRSFKNKTDRKIFIVELKEYLQFINPLDLELLSAALSMNVKHLKEQLFYLIKKHIIHAEIKNNELIMLGSPRGEFLLSFYKKVEIIGSKIVFNLRIHNQTKFIINNIQLMFLYPDFLKLEKEESDPTEIKIREFESDAIRIIKWTFRINKKSAKKYELKTWLLNISYKNVFNKISTLQKEMEIIL